MWRWFLLVLVFALIVFATSAEAGDFEMTAPVEAASTAEIIKAAEKEDVAGGLRREPYVSSAEYQLRSRRVFAAWYNPYSGEAACHVYIYVFDRESRKWVQKLATKYQGTSNVSVEMGSTISIRDLKGKVVYQLKE